MVESGLEASQAVGVESPGTSFESWLWTRLEYLTRSQKRIRILHHLQEQSGRKREIAEQLDIPHSTLLRTLKEMGEYGWIIEVKNGKYDITPIGSVVVDVFEEFLRRFESLAGLSQLYRILPSELMEGAPVEIMHLTEISPSEIKMCLATPASPYAPMQRFAEKIRTADINCVFLGIMNPFYNDPIRQLLEEGSVKQLIVPRDVINVICQSEQPHPNPIDQSVSISVTEGQFRYAGFTTEDHLLIEGLDEDMKTQIVVELPLHSGIVTDWASHLIGLLEEEATLFNQTEQYSDN